MSGPRGRDSSSFAGAGEVRQGRGGVHMGGIQGGGT